MRVVISGVAGVGKSTVLDLVKKGTDYDVINFGTLMFEMAKDIGIVQNRDELRKLPVDTQINLQKKASNVIGKMDKVIVDTHMSIKSHGGFLPGLPEWVLRELKIGAFFIIEADPNLIVERRKSDGTRTRDSATGEDIRTHQEINRYYAAAYSVYTGATVNIIDNPDGKPNIAANTIISRLRTND